MTKHSVNLSKTMLNPSQHIQIFLVRKILDEDHTMATFFAEENIHDFFRQWSQIVCDNKDKKDFPLTINVPAYFLTHTDEPVEKEVDLIVLGEKITKRYTPTESKLDVFPEAYHSLLKDLKFAPFFSLLKDTNLGQLMLIEYPADTSGIPGRAEHSPDEDIITEAIAKQLGIKPSEITADHRQKLTTLDLANRNITDLTPLQKLTNLKILWLSNTQVTDLTPLKYLTNLQDLEFANTKVNNLTPLQNLINLQRLGLENTQVGDLTPLRNLQSLEYIDISNTPAARDEDQIKAIEKALPKLIINQ